MTLTPIALFWLMVWAVAVERVLGHLVGFSLFLGKRELDRRRARRQYADREREAYVEHETMRAQQLASIEAQLPRACPEHGENNPDCDWAEHRAQKVTELITMWDRFAKRALRGRLHDLREEAGLPPLADAAEDTNVEEANDVRSE